MTLAKEFKSCQCLSEVQVIQMAMTPEITVVLLQTRAVNQAAEAGIVPVAAIGNDGRRRVTSVGAADQAITVGSIDDKDTIDRGDDSIASYSNSGPREDDGDDDRKELKPDVVAPGSDIISAAHAASSSQLPGTPKPLAEDSYTEHEWDEYGMSRSSRFGSSDFTN